MPRYFYYFLVAVFILLGSRISTLAASDIFNLSYTLTEGGTRLELTPLNPYKGVQITVTSNVSTRYEVIQRVINPLVNQDNPGAALGNNFVFRGLRGTNNYGDFRVPVTDSPPRSNEVLYVSDTAGDADTFTLAYGITNLQDIEAGHYFGRFGFILNPISSTRPQVTQILDVYVTISREETKPKIEISTSSGGKVISLNPQKTEMQVADVTVKINSKSRKPFSISQVLTQPLVSEEGVRLDSNRVNFTTREVKLGLAEGKNTPLFSGRPQNVYSSAPSGQADNFFVISYGLTDFSAVKAGRYRSQIQYLLEEMGAQTRLDTLDLEIENARLFDLQITPLDQRYAIIFTNVKPTEPPKKSEVLIEIKTNLGKPYQVNQEVLSELTSPEGIKVPEEYFTMHTESIDSTRGKLKFSSEDQVKKGSSVLFLSDNQGAADKFKVVYTLTSPKDLKTGDYSSRITYSLSEI